MNVLRTERGFQIIECQPYGRDQQSGPPGMVRLVQQSSAIGNYVDSYDKPGSSYLWFGDDHHLDREQVADLIEHLQAWLETGSLQKE